MSAYLIRKSFECERESDRFEPTEADCAGYSGQEFPLGSLISTVRVTWQSIATRITGGRTELIALFCG